MKTKTTISEITHEDLVNLLCTATFESSWLSIKKPNGSYYGTELESENDCLEDTWAKVLLSGRPLFAFDYYAESEEDYFGILPHKWIDDAIEPRMRYEFNLEDIKIGLANAMNGDFTCYCNERDWARRSVISLMEEDGDMDNPAAELLMQIILFNEVIY